MESTHEFPFVLMQTKSKMIQKHNQGKCFVKVQMTNVLQYYRDSLPTLS